MDTDRLIRAAIEQRRLIRFTLNGRARVAEPHDYGLRAGEPQLLVFQVGGDSSSGKLPDWRWVKLSRASDFELLAETFPGGRVAPSGQHSRWDTLFLRVSPASSR